jgi:hypothetical protein
VIHPGKSSFKLIEELSTTVDCILERLESLETSVADLEARSPLERPFDVAKASAAVVDLNLSVANHSVRVNRLERELAVVRGATHHIKSQLGQVAGLLSAGQVHEE